MGDFDEHHWGCSVSVITYRSAAPVQLSSASINKAFVVLRSCLDDAVRDGLLARNPARAVKQPAISKTEARYLTFAEVRALLEQLAGGRHERIVTLIAHLGLRKGEALALRWSDVDMDRSRLRISGTLTRLNGQLVTTEPKTASSRRWRPLSRDLLLLSTFSDRRRRKIRRRAANTWSRAAWSSRPRVASPWTRAMCCVP